MVSRQGVLAAYRLCFVLWTVLFLRFALPVCAETQSPSAADGKAGAVRGEKTPATSAQADLAGKNVLILHALEANIPLNVRTDRAMMASLEAGGVGLKAQFYEHLDLHRHPGAKRRQLLTEMLRVRYDDHKIDAIITLYPEALHFVLDEGRTIFIDAPIVALYMYPGFEASKTGTRIVQHVLRNDIAGTFESALKLVPETKSVYVVSGVHPVDKKNEAQARLDLRKWQGRLDFRYLSDMSLEEMLAAISGAPRESVILYLAILASQQKVSSFENRYRCKDGTYRWLAWSSVPIGGAIHAAARDITEQKRSKEYGTPRGYRKAEHGWIEEFSKALRRGRPAELLTLIDRIRPAHADLAEAPAGLVRIHAFDTLIAVTEGARTGASHG